VPFMVLNINHCSFSRYHIFPEEPAAQKHIIFRKPGYNFPIPP
jgi:hypothetical protein